jgi:hypothetical protein
MFTNTKIRTKCEFQGMGCTGVSTLEVPDEDYPPEVIMVCTSCCLDIAEGAVGGYKVSDGNVSQECPECERELDADATSCHNCDPKF